MSSESSSLNSTGAINGMPSTFASAGKKMMSSQDKKRRLNLFNPHFVAKVHRTIEDLLNTSCRSMATNEASSQFREQLAKERNVADVAFFTKPNVRHISLNGRSDGCSNIEHYFFVFYLIPRSAH